MQLLLIGKKGIELVKDKRMWKPFDHKKQGPVIMMLNKGTKPRKKRDCGDLSSDHCATESYI